MVKRSTALESALSGHAKRSRCYSDDELVQKKIKDNFPGFAPEETDVRKGSDGRTLRAKLLYDLQQSKLPGVKLSFGAKYYRDLKAIYRNPNGAFTALRCDTQDLQISPALLRALTATKRSPADWTLIQSFMRTATSMNELEVSGFFRWMISLKVGSFAQLPIALAAVNFVLRIQIFKTASEQFGVVRFWVDDVMVASLRSSRRQGVRDCVFINMHMDNLGMLCHNKDDLNSVMQCEEQWSKVHVELSRLVEGSQVCALLFGHSLDMVTSQLLQEKIRKHVAAFFGPDTEITVLAMMDAIATCLKELEVLPGVAGIAQNRNAKIEYSPLELEIPVCSISEEVHVCFHATLKSLAVKAGVLQKTGAEAVILEVEGCGTSACVPLKAKVGTEMMKLAEAARESCRKAIADGVAESADMIQALLQKMKGHFLLIDPFFTIELAMANSIVGERCEALMSKAIMKCLPSRRLHMEPEHAARKLDLLANGTLFKMSIRSAQAKVRLVQRMISDIISCCQPIFSDDMKTSPIVKEAITALQWFLKVEKNKVGFLYGVEALTFMIELAGSKAQDKTATLEDLQPLVIFAWLVPQDLKEKVEKLVASVRDGVAEELRSKATQVKIAKASRRTGADDATTAALSFFT